MHLYGGAADISVNGDRSKAGMHRAGVIAKQMYDEGLIGGLGLGNRCVHIDIRHLKLVTYPNHKFMWFYDGHKTYDEWFKKTK